MSSSEGVYGGALGARRPFQGVRVQTVTVWLGLLLIAASWIVVIDGLARPGKSVEETVGNEALQYEAFTGAVIFAAVSFPLVLLHARRTGASKSEGLLLWLALGTVAYAKDFAYIKVPDAPIFVTDVVLAILCFSVFVWPRLRIVKLRSRLVGSLACFFLIGVVALLRGLASGQDRALSFRDFAIVVYPAFTLVGLYLLKSWASISRVMQMLVLGAALASLNGIAWFVAQPGLRRYIAFGIWIVIAIMMLAVWVIRGAMTLALAGPLGLLLAFGLVMSNARTLYVVLGLAVVLFLLSGRQLVGRFSRAKLLKIAAFGAILVAGTVFLLTKTQAGQEYVQRQTEQLVLGVAHSEDDDNTQFRLLAWAEALYRFAAQPVFGEGFGVPFLFERADNDSRPHNTYLTVLYKMGVVGILPLLFVLFHVVWKGWKTMRASLSSRHNYLLVILLLTQVMLCAYGSFNLLLESPFLASLFWLNLGMISRAIALLQREMRESPAIAAP